MGSLYHRAERRDVAVGGERLELSVVHVKNGGAGPRLLLLHGNPGTLDDFVNLAESLSFAAELLLFDLPGFGKSPPAQDPRTSSLAGLARVARAVTDSFGWQTFHVVGHSHGGGVAQAMAWGSSQRVQGLLLLSSLGFPAHPAYRQLALPGVGAAMRLIAGCVGLPGGKTWLKGVQTGIAKKAFYPEPLPEGRLDRDVETIRSAPTILSSMVNVAKGEPCAELSQHVASIASRTMFLHGDSDRLVPARHSKHLHDLRVAAGRDSVFELIAGAGHMLPITHADLIARRLQGAPGG
jgi:pimeloyl-ACP methyl ester carboxylesterase